MVVRPEAPKEIAVPISIFASLRQSLTAEAGALPTIHALHDAGYRAGVEAARGLASGAEDPMGLPESAFWDRVTQFFSRRGWGTLTHTKRHEAVGELSAADWVEGDHEGDEDASCSFTTGFLSGMLTTLAGGPVAVLEVSCRARGERQCSFAYGNASAIHEVYGMLLDGSELDEALSGL